MKKIVGLGFVLSGALVFSGVAVAAESAVASVGTNVCVVEIAKVLHDSPLVKSDVDALKAKFKKDQDAIEVKQKALEKKMADLKKNDAVMSSAEKSKTEKAIADERQGLITEIGAFQQKLTAEQKAMMDVVFKNLNGVVQSVAKTDKCDVVLDSQFVLYAVPTHDVTADVEKLFDTSAKKKDKK